MKKHKGLYRFLIMLVVVFLVFMSVVPTFL